MNQSSMRSSVPTIKCEEVPSPAGAEDPGGAYNLNVNVNLSAAVIGLLTADAASTTLRTPEIVNDLITMTNPLDQYNYNEKTSGFKSASGNDSNSSMSTGSSATSPASGTPPSIQKTCSELIKAGLKLSIESKRKMSGSDTDVAVKRMKREDSDDDYDSSHTNTTKGEGLTPEDEERRRRRRERNKIAATKCRLKKRERTGNLITESEILESQNVDLKRQLKDLEVEKHHLMEMLTNHRASPKCYKQNGTSRSSPNTNYNQIRYETNTFPTSFDQSPYIRPESANILASSSSFTCPTLLGGEIETITAIDTIYMPQVIESDYRPDSVLSLQNSDGSYVTTDGFMPKSTNLLVPIESEQEYYEQEVNYNLSAQQCHTYPATVPDSQAKLNNGHNDGCLV